MRTLSFGEVLTTEQATECIRILKSTSKPSERVQRLRDYLAMAAGEKLKEIQILPEYLAYAIEFKSHGDGALFDRIVKFVHDTEQTRNN